MGFGLLNEWSMRNGAILEVRYTILKAGVKSRGLKKVPRKEPQFLHPLTL